MTIDIDAIRQRADRLAQMLSRSGDHPAAVSERAREIATEDVPALLAKVDELTEKIERRRLRLVEAENDLLDVRGILSPNGYPRRVPVDLVPTVAPAVRWLADRVDALTAALAAKDAVIEAAKEWRRAVAETGDYEISDSDVLIAAIDALPKTSEVAR